MKIGKRYKAKKYASLREKQRLANQMLYYSSHIEKSHTKRQIVLKRKQQFYKSRGLKNPSRLSFKDLSTADLPAYEILLDSIINNTYINPKKYKEHIDKQRERFEEQGYENISFEDAQRIYESDILQQLFEMHIDPSELMAVLDYYNGCGLSYEQFINACSQFINDKDAGATTVDDFFAYMYDYADRYA